jgi:hypothetical protein
LATLRVGAAVAPMAQFATRVAGVLFMDQDVQHLVKGAAVGVGWAFDETCG